MNQPQKEISSLLDYSHEVTGLDQFILYGGTPLDLMIHGSYHDIDLATQGKSEEWITALNKQFSAKGFDVIQPRRPYQIRNGSVEVILVYAKNDANFFDVCFMEDLSLIGLFDIESSYWKYPKKEHVDQYNALEALASKCIRPIRSFESENPLLWFSRFVRLCSKYNFQMTNTSHAPIIDAINSRVGYDEQTVSSPQYSSAVSSVFSAILRAKDRQKFSSELIETGLIRKLLPELDKFLSRTNEDVLIRIRNREEFCGILRENLSPEERVDLDKKLQELSYRSWENE